MKVKLIGILFSMIAFAGIMMSCSDDEDSSTGPDTTAPTVWVSAPADSFKVIDGIPVTITAGVSDNVGVTKVEFYIDSILTSTDSIPSDFEYIWGTVGKQGEHTVFLKAYDAAGNIGESLPILIIVTPPQTITVTSPIGSDEWMQGGTYDITWNNSLEDTLVQIELYIATTTLVSTLSSETENDGVFSWTIPQDQLASNNYSIKIQGKETGINDMSSTFTITDSKYILVTSPNGGESWLLDTEYEITWQDNIEEQVKIELFRASTLELTISDSTDSDGSFMWTVPNTVPTGLNYKIRISSYPVATVVDNSDASFTISAP